MVVPPQLVGALLGKEGCEIKLLASTTGCKTLGVTKREFGERRVIIMGTFIQCITAQKALQDVLWAAADKAGIDVTTSTIVFYIRSAQVGCVVGKRGDKLKEIRELTGAKLKVEREEVNNQRACVINGPHEQVMQAVSMVNELLSTSAHLASAAPVVTGKRSAPSPAASGKGGDAKRQKVGPEGGITKLLVPAQLAGLIIGKQGSKLAQIRQSCSVHLEVLPEQQTPPQWPGSRLVKLQGSLQSRALAAMTVLQSAFHADISSVMLKMPVPETKAGAVVGKAGSNLKMIREQSGINVQLEKAAVMGDRLVTATGSLESIKAVTSWIMQAVDASHDAASVAPANGYSNNSAPTNVAPVGYNYAPAYGGYNYAAYGLAY
jgi:predicted PilT family ATPase